MAKNGILITGGSGLVGAYTVAMLLLSGTALNLFVSATPAVSTDLRQRRSGQRGKSLFSK
jgi:uncharacterized protein YbjT (DUF2867 family)